MAVPASWRQYCALEYFRGAPPAGEDEDMKRMMWVVENLQEELLAADTARLAADELVRARSSIVRGLQARPPVRCHFWLITFRGPHSDRAPCSAASTASHATCP